MTFLVLSPSLNIALSTDRQRKIPNNHTHYSDRVPEGGAAKLSVCNCVELEVR